MACIELVILITDSRDAASGALRELKRLNREGWIDLASYALVDQAEEGSTRFREISDTGTLTACLAPLHLQPGDSALLVMVEDRFAERVEEELETRGFTVRRQFGGDHCETALRASIEGIKGKIAWLEELLDHESDKAAWISDAGKERLESAIRAGRMELRAERGRLQARLLALRKELEARLTANGNGIVEVERDIADVNEDLALCILDHLDGLATLGSELREKAARSGGEAATGFEDQLREIEVQVRKCRADLTATLASSGTLVRRCLERSKAISAPHMSRGESELQNHGRQLEQRHARLKADIREFQKEDSRAWHDMAGGLHQAWRSLRETPDGVRECQ
jgi:uncharacterized membrane protein